MSEPAPLGVSRQHRRLKRRRWERTRRRALDRDGWRCQACVRPGRLEVDHRVPLERGGPEYDLSNLQTLCRRCHFEKTARENVKDPARLAWRDYLGTLE